MHFSSWFYSQKISNGFLMNLRVWPWVIIQINQSLIPFGEETTGQIYRNKKREDQWTTVSLPIAVYHLLGILKCFLMLLSLFILFVKVSEPEKIWHIHQIIYYENMQNEAKSSDSRPKESLQENDVDNGSISDWFSYSAWRFSRKFFRMICFQTMTKKWIS